MPTAEHGSSLKRLRHWMQILTAGRKKRIERSPHTLTYLCIVCFISPRLHIMPSLSAELLPERGQCTQTCNCNAALFGPFYRANPLYATENCNCKHAWWMHTVIIPATTGPGGCHSTGCGGYCPTVTSLLTLEPIRHSFRPRRMKELTLGHVYVASHMTSTSNLSRLHPSQTPGPSLLVALQHMRMLTLAVRPRRTGSRPPRR
jgi:hypothetical protein